MQTNLLKPKTINVEQLGHNRAKVVLEPFERGYGHTLGNAIRRVLLSSMVGYAVTEVTIAGVLHEYSSVDGVQEDVVNILLNLKGVVFKLHNRDEVTLSLRKDVEGLVTARDIQTPHDVEIVNPDHVIAHLSQGGKLDMQVKVEKGRGYVPGNQRRYGDEATKSIGRIVLDASFSPIKRVSYTVESARVEQRTDLDKLVVEIETNGAVTAEDAVRASARILVEQLAVFAQLDGGEIGALAELGGLGRDAILDVGAERQQIERPAQGRGAGLMACEEEDRHLIDHFRRGKALSGLRVGGGHDLGRKIIGGGARDDFRRAGLGQAGDQVADHFG